MKKFVLLYQGFIEPSEEVKESWMEWFGVLGNRVVDSGNPFGPGKVVSKAGVNDLALDSQAIAGYTIINAESIDEVAKLAEACPIVTSLHIYEAMPM